MRTSRRNTLLLSIVFLLLSVLAIFIITYEIVSFTEPPWYYHPISDVEKLNASIPSIVMLTYFTHLTVLYFGIWGIGYFIAVVADFKLLKRIVLNNYVILSLAIFSAMTCLMYTGSQLFSAVPFGFEGTDINEIIGFIFGLCMHYIIPLTVLYYYFFINTPKKLKFKNSLFIIVACILYLAVVKFMGMFCYNVEWYPYAVFTPQGLWEVLPFGGEYNPVLMGVIMSVLFVLFVVAVGLLLYLFVKYANVKERKQAVKSKGKKR